jgi:hypothetical protein
MLAGELAGQFVKNATDTTFVVAGDRGNLV